MGLRKPVQIAAVAVVLALSAVVAPGARPSCAAGGHATEYYRVTGSGPLYYSATIMADDAILIRRVCNEFGDHIRSVFGLPASQQVVTFTRTRFKGTPSTCAVDEFRVPDHAPFLAGNGPTYTITMPLHVTEPIAGATGLTMRMVRAWVGDAVITSVSGGGLVDHDPDSKGWEKAVWYQDFEDITLDYDVSTGTTSTGAVHPPSNNDPPEPEPADDPQSPQSLAGASPSAGASTPASGRTGAAKRGYNRSGLRSPSLSDQLCQDCDAKRRIASATVLIFILVVLLRLIAKGAGWPRRPGEARKARRPARSRAPVRPRPAEPEDPVFPYGRAGPESGPRASSAAPSAHTEPEGAGGAEPESSEHPPKTAPRRSRRR